MPTDGKVNVMVRLSKRERELLKLRTIREGTSIQAVLHACVHAYLTGSRWRRKGRPAGS